MSALHPFVAQAAAGPQAGADPVAAGPPLAAPQAPGLPSVPPWPKPPDGYPLVPDPATLTQYHLDLVDYVGAQVWAAAAATAGAQTATTRGLAENAATRLRSVPWKKAFMAEHPGMFAANPSGERSARQFHVGFMLVGAVRRAALEATAPGDKAGWFDWLAPIPAPDVEAVGYCYRVLCPDRLDSDQMCADLGPWPTAAELADWFTTYSGELPGPFLVRGEASVLRFHVGPGPGAITACFRGDPLGARIGAHELDPRARLGGADDALVPPPIATDPGGTNEVVLRGTYAQDVEFTQALCDIAALADLVTTWASVRVVGLSAKLLHGDTNAHLAVALSSPARRSALPLGPSVAAEALAHAESFLVITSTATNVGRDEAVLELPRGSVDLELSQLRPPAGHHRPDLTVRFRASGSAVALITLRVRISGPALVCLSGDEFAGPEAESAAEG